MTSTGKANVREKGGSWEIRELRADEEEDFLEVGRRAFPIFMRPFFDLGNENLVALRDEKILGGLVMRTLTSKDGPTVGVASWLFVDEEARGLGIGSALTTEGVRRDEGCDFVTAVVDGDNTSSSRIVESMGLRQVGWRSQIQALGLSMALRTAIVSRALFSPGHFLYRRRDKEATEALPAERRGGEFWISAVVFSVLAALAGWRSGFETSRIAMAMIAAFTILIFREIGTRLAARLQDLRLEHRAWDGGYLMSLAIALIFGGVYPMPGGLYPRDADWRAKDERMRRGRAALVGVVPAMSVGLFAVLLTVYGDSDLEPMVQALRFIVVPFLIFDVILIFFPFQHFHGRRILEWSRPIWIITATIALAIVLAMIL